MEFDRETDFSQFKTFYTNQGQINAKNPVLNNDLVRKQVQDGIRQRLTAKGLAEVTAGAI